MRGTGVGSMTIHINDRLNNPSGLLGSDSLPAQGNHLRKVCNGS